MQVALGADFLLYLSAVSPRRPYSSVYPSRPRVASFLDTSSPNFVKRRTRAGEISNGSHENKRRLSVIIQQYSLKHPRKDKRLMSCCNSKGPTDIKRPKCPNSLPVMLIPSKKRRAGRSTRPREVRSARVRCRHPNQ